MHVFNNIISQIVVLGLLTSAEYRHFQSTVAHLESRQLCRDTRQRKQGSCPCWRQTIVPR